MINKHTFTRKGYGRIYVADPSKVEEVKQIIRNMDEFEFAYLPKDMVAPFSEYPRVCYTSKFDDLDLHELTARCFSQGIYIWCCDNGHEEWMESAFPQPEAGGQVKTMRN